jgi:hypothetical protein
VIFLGFLCLALTEEPFIKNGSVNWMPVYVSLLLGLFMVAAGIICIGNLKWLISGDPLLVIDAERVSIRNLFGKVHSARWSKIRKISIKERESVSRKSTFRYQTLDFYVLTEKEQDRIPPFLTVAQYEIDISFQDIVAELKKIPAAAAILDSSATEPNQPSKKTSSRKISFKIALVIALAICIEVFIYYKIALKAGVVGYVQAAKTEITCSRHKSEKAAICICTEWDRDGKLLTKQAIVDVVKMEIKQNKLPTFYISSSVKEVPIAAVDLNQVHNGVDSEKTEPLASINKLQSFIDDPQQVSVSVTY